MSVEEIIRERVERGMAWIKENAERLDLDLDRVELDRLSIASPEWCVIGQAGGIVNGLNGWYRLCDADLLPDDDGRQEGFLPEWSLSSDSADLLTEAWRNAILTERDR